MILSDVSIRRPVFTAMVTIALMTLGLLGATSLGVDLFPDMSFPVAAVVTVYPGAGPEEVEQLVTKPIEEAVSGINGVDEVRSYSRDSVSTIIVMFKLEADLKMSATDVRDKVTAIRSKLPDDIQDPIIQRMDPTALPIITYAVSFPGTSDRARRIVDDEIKPKLESVDGVAAVNVYGGLQREIHIFVDRASMESLGISLAGLAQQIGADSFDLPSGRIELGATELSVKTLGNLRSVDELRAMVVASLPSGAQVRLSEIAQVEDGFKEERTRTRLSDASGVREAVVFEVQKAGGSNTVQIAEDIYKKLDDIKKTLPPEVKIHKAIDSSTFIRNNIADVREAILFGGAMAILVIFLFMLDWRSTLISSLALPTSVVATFFIMWLLGFGFNMMTLMALSLSIGLLIDDSVVVRENIYRHMERGADPITAARKGTAEIGLAVMATTFTIVAVFVPVAFMGGIVGRMFREFGLTVVAAVLVSLFVSFTLDPMLSARVMKPIAPGHHDAMRHHRIFGVIIRGFDQIDAFYRRLLAWALHRKKTVVGLSVLVFGLSMSLIPLMGFEFMSAGDRGEFRILLEMPAGTSLNEMDRVTAQAEALIRKNPEVHSLYTTVAPNEEVNKATVRVYATKKEERKVTQWDIQDDLRKQLSTIPSLKYVFADLGIIEAASHELPIMLYVRGDNYAALQRTAREALEILKRTDGVKDADMSFRPGRSETHIKIDRAKAADQGVSLGSIAQTARLALEGDVVAKLRESDRDWDIRLQLAPKDRMSLGPLTDLTVPATGRRLGGVAQGGIRMVRLKDVADIVPETGPATIERMNRQRQIIISANNEGRSLGEVVNDVEAGLAKLPKSAGTSFAWGGQAENMRDTFSNMILALLVAVIFIYFVLASQFESFIHPLTIMVALPLAMVGAMILLFLTGFPIGMPAMIGIILLMGLVTKNAILLVDYTNELRARGMPMLEALLTAGPTRLRPILMTSAAMVLGMLPSALTTAEGSEFRAPMALVVIGGVITSTFLTLVVVPIVYTWMDRLTLKQKSAATRDPFLEEAALEEPLGDRASIHSPTGERT